jgi:hypothetical protein
MGDEEFVVEAETFSETVATIPLGMVPEPRLHSMHRKLPV